MSPRDPDIFLDGDEPGAQDETEEEGEESAAEDLDNSLVDSENEDARKRIFTIS